MRSIIVLLLTIFQTANAIIGYDCGGSGMNLTTLSLLDIGTCDQINIEPQEEDVNVQLLQLSDYDHTMVVQCKVEIDRTIFYCGMHSHVSAVHNGRREYLLSMSQHTCNQLHATGTLDLGGHAQISGIRPNTTDYRSVTLAGSLAVDGTCFGTEYSDPYGTWTNVVIQASVKITIRSYQAQIKLSTNRVILDSGVHCVVSDGYCLDNNNGETFWSPIPVGASCEFNRYDVLYDGLAKKLTPKEGQEAPAIYTVNTQETTFALTKTAQTNLCGYTLIKTEHPKLFILEVRKGHTFRRRTGISVDNLDIFSYVNSKFVYVEKHLKTQMTQLYRDIIAQKCALEQQVLKNALALSSIAPEELAFSLMKGPGYMAVTAGEAIHIIKCIPVECKVRQVTECYKELPVMHRNESLFLQPKSRILNRIGTPRDCSELIPVMYNIKGVWYKMLLRLIESIPPQVIQPLIKPAWKYTSPESLATSGIYNTQDLERLKDHIMFPMEQPSMLATIAKGAMGRDIPHGSIRMINLLDDETIYRIAESAGQKLWNGFLKFGSASAGILGIFIILKGIKYLVDVIIRGYALHGIYGWSVHIFAALWSSIANLIVHLAGSPSTRRNIEDAETKTNPACVDQSTSANQQPDPTERSNADFTTPEPPVKYTVKPPEDPTLRVRYPDLAAYLDMSSPHAYIQTHRQTHTHSNLI